MRCLKLLMIGGMVLAMTVPAVAVSFRYDYNGPIFMHVANYAMGTTYNGKVWDGASYQSAYNGSNWYNPASGLWDLPGTASPMYNPATLGVLTSAAGAKAGENGWGVVEVSGIYKGKVVGFNNIQILDVGNPLWLPGDNGQEIVAAYFNRVDTGVAFLDTAGAHQAFEFNGDTFEIIVQPQNTYDQGMAGSSGRVVGQDKYATIGYDASGAPLAGATVIMSGVGEVGYYGTQPLTTGIADFYASGVYAGSGQADQFYSVTGGTEMLFWDTDWFTPVKIGGNPADLRIHVTDSPAGGFSDWLTSSSDPLTANFVPEPVTMAGMLLGIGCLGRYIRRRR